MELQAAQQIIKKKKKFSDIKFYEDPFSGTDGRTDSWKWLWNNLQITHNLEATFFIPSVYDLVSQSIPLKQIFSKFRIGGLSLKLVQLSRCVAEFAVTKVTSLETIMGGAGIKLCQQFAVGYTDSMTDVSRTISEITGLLYRQHNF